MVIQRNIRQRRIGVGATVSFFASSLGLSSLLWGPIFPPQLCAADNVRTRFTSEVAAPTKPALRWTEIAPGLTSTKYHTDNDFGPLRSEVLVLKIDLARYELDVIRATDVNLSTTDLKTLAIRAGAVAGINAHFFDVDNNPLGLIVRNGALKQKLQRGGRLLTGVFYVAGGKAGIVHRDGFYDIGGEDSPLELALQAGPRLVDDGKIIPASADQGETRRSGVAVCRDGKVLLYATMLRFPGASFEQIQSMLLDPELAVVDALNLDGGGSSQLFIESSSSSPDEVFVTGGDLVPSGIVVKARK